MRTHAKKFVQNKKIGEMPIFFFSHFVSKHRLSSYYGREVNMKIICVKIPKFLKPLVKFFKKFRKEKSPSV